MAGRITRTRPNVLVTGTPGTGKTITCCEVADKTGYKHVDVGQVAKVNRYYEGWDKQYQCPILDEDKVIDFVSVNINRCMCRYCTLNASIDESEVCRHSVRSIREFCYFVYRSRHYT